MLFLANRTNLDKRTLLTRIHDRFQTQVSKESSPITQVRYQTSPGNKVGVEATVKTSSFLPGTYPVAQAAIQISFDFPKSHSYDFYEIQWIDAERDLLLGWHQDEMHVDLGKCHFQIDYQGETVQRTSAEFLDRHPLNVVEQRLADLVTVHDALRWENDPVVPSDVLG